MSKYPKVKFGDFVEHVVREVELEADKEYPSVGVKWYGEGVHVHEVKSGASFNASRFEIKANDIIYNDMWARNGSVAIVPPHLNASVASSHFPTFLPDLKRVLPQYLEYYFKTPTFWDDCENASRGSTGRNQIKKSTFYAIEIPLPSLDEQRRVVSNIESLEARVKKVQHMRAEADEETEMLVQQSIWKIFADEEKESKHIKRLGDICDFQGGSQPPKSVFAYEPIDGYIRLIQIRDYKSNNCLTYVPKDSVTRFCSADDVMIGRYGPPVFQILRGIEGAYNVAIMKTVPDPAILSKDYLYYLLQEPNFHKKVVDDSQRTSGQTGIRKELLQDHMTYVPPLDEQRRIVAYMNGLQAKVNELRELQSASGEELSALMPSILDKAFKGEL
jgi:type I restriction enzyme, S subunit